MFLFPSQTAAAVTPQVSAGRRAELCLFCTENTQHGPSSQWRVSHYLSTTQTLAAVACVSLSFYNTDPGRSGVCLTIFLQHGPRPQWHVSHYLSTTWTLAAVACVSLSFYNTTHAAVACVSLSFYSTDTGRSGVCLTIFLQHGPWLQWLVSHYLSTTRTQAAVAEKQERLCGPAPDPATWEHLWWL